MSDVRPKRRAIPVTVKREVCERQGFRCKDCGDSPVSALPRSGTDYDHRPSLRLRDICDDGSDYIPQQCDPVYIDALCEDCHKIRTFVKNGADFSDLTKIARERRREKKRTETRPKRKWPSKKLQSRKFQRRIKP